MVTRDHENIVGVKGVQFGSQNYLKTFFDPMKTHGEDTILV